MDLAVARAERVVTPILARDAAAPAERVMMPALAIDARVLTALVVGFGLDLGLGVALNVGLTARARTFGAGDGPCTFAGSSVEGCSLDAAGLGWAKLDDDARMNDGEVTVAMGG